MRVKVAVVTSHPIQYNAPLFRALSVHEDLDVKVFYTWGEESVRPKYDPGFDKIIEWDTPLLEGYNFNFLHNTAKKKGSSHFMGIINPDIIRQIEQFSPHAILIYGWAFASHLKVMRHFKGKCPLFFRGDSVLLSENQGFKSLLRKGFLKWIYKHVDFAFYVGESNRAYFERAGLKPQQLIYCPHSVDNVFFTKDEDERKQAAAQMRVELGIGYSDTVLLYAGKFEEVKNLPFFVKTFKDANLNGSHLVLAGNGTLEQDIRSIAGDSATIHFLPFQNQSRMPVLYRLSDIYVLPSKSETWGLSVNEAMCCGNALLISKRCGCQKELLKEGCNGYSFEYNNSNELTKSLLLLMADKTKLEQMKNYSRELIQDFSTERVAEIMRTHFIQSAQLF